MVEPQTEKKGPFSPLQTGCAFLMLTNMLIYLGVIAFIFNLLDPSKLNPDYLAKRGFITQDQDSPGDQKFRQLTEAKEKEQQAFVDSIISEAAQSKAQEISVAKELSKHKKRSLAVSRPKQEKPPSAGQTPEPFFKKLGEIHPVKTGVPSPYRVPRTKTYVPYRIPASVPPVKEGYDLPNLKLGNKSNFPIAGILFSENTNDAPHLLPSEDSPSTNDAAPLQADTPEQIKDKL
ncbi:MAG: hypothetical protein ISR84_06175 [Kiritimatiellales bacterium]|nr:hypothetical protein [Kiritimatiellales bacterium]